MARMPGATWRPISVNYTNGGQRSVRGVVVHIMAGTLAGTDSWFRNPAANASSHFGTGKDGDLYQWVDTSDRAWAQAGGNSDWLSVENEGRGGDQLTDAQVQRNAEVLAWAHRLYEVPLQVTHSPSGRGLGYHAMGGSAWGGHTSCPGSRIVAQLDDIVARARQLAGGTAAEEDPMAGMSEKDIAQAVWSTDGVFKVPEKWRGKNTTNTHWHAQNAVQFIGDRTLEILAEVGAHRAVVEKLLEKVGDDGGLTADEIEAAAQAGARAALAELGQALTTKEN